ncbi:hypothetical protein [Brachyspira sp.]|uniref:hypothetical protein n=1 Tax=Brachyspira sp. TaxID=1977261 RepID=UPI0026160E55|nr:hypothetical protein [Brachyspira sp.]
MIETFIYIIISISLFIMFSIAWKNLLKSLCRRYLIIQKINFIKNNQKKYVKYINLLIKDSYHFSIYDHIINVSVAEKIGLFKNIDKREEDPLIYEIVSIYLLFMTLSSIVFSILAILILILIIIFSMCSMVFKNSLKLFNIIRNVKLYSKLYIINNMHH